MGSLSQRPLLLVLVLRRLIKGGRRRALREGGPCPGLEAWGGQEKGGALPRSGERLCTQPALQPASLCLQGASWKRDPAVRSGFSQLAPAGLS